MPWPKLMEPQQATRDTGAASVQWNTIRTCAQMELAAAGMPAGPMPMPAPVLMSTSPSRPLHAPRWHCTASICQPAGHHVRLSALCHVVDLGSDSRGVLAPSLHPCPPAHPEVLCRHGKTMSMALMPSPGAGLSTSGNIRLPSAPAMPSLSHVALTSRTSLALDSGLMHLAPLQLLMPTSFPPRSVLRHIPPPLLLVYI
jgi:hypothetical protein